MADPTGDGRVHRAARLRWVPINEMRVSPVAQRELNRARVDYLTANLDLEQIGSPTVSHRDGHYYIIDGQHRIEALRDFGLGDEKIECWCYEGLTEQEEASKFDQLNDVLAVHAFDKYRTRVTAGREVETAIEHVVRTEGLVVSRESVPGAIRAVGTLRRVFTRADGQVLGRALRIIRDAYGDAGFDAPVIDGIGYLCQRYNGQIDDTDAVRLLGAVNGGVNGLLGKAEIIRRATGNTKGHCVAAAAVDILNAKRGGKKIPGWFRS